jgi:hypothetical protein
MLALGYAKLRSAVDVWNHYSVRDVGCLSNDNVKYDFDLINILIDVLFLIWILDMATL